MSPQIPAAVLAQADQEVANLKERIDYLIKAYRVLGRDEIRDGAWLCAKLTDSAFSRADLSALLAVAVSMLAERPEGPEVAR